MGVLGFLEVLYIYPFDGVLRFASLFPLGVPIHNDNISADNISADKIFRHQFKILGSWLVYADHQ